MKKEGEKRERGKKLNKAKTSKDVILRYFVLVNKSHALKHEYLSTMDYGFPAQDPDDTS